MNIARASAQDIEAALVLLGLLDTVGKGYYPSDLDGDDSDDPLMFDPENPVHLEQLWKRLQACLQQAPGFPGRVIFGGVTLMDPRNRIIDEAADVLQLHPTLIRRA